MRSKFGNRGQLRASIWWIVIFAGFACFSRAESNAWLSQVNLSHDEVTSALRGLETMDRAGVEALLATLGQSKDQLSAEGKLARRLLIGAVWEKLGDRSEALKSYKTLTTDAETELKVQHPEVLSQGQDAADAAAERLMGASLSDMRAAEGTVYSKSAAIRIRILNLDQNKKALDRTLNDMIGENDAPCWFRYSDGWQWTSSRTAACRDLVLQRSDELSFRFFHWLRDLSPLDDAYSYLFVLFVVAVGVKILQFPLLVKSARLRLRLQVLQPQIAAIQGNPTTDFATKNQELMALYQRNNLNIFGGCAVLFLDLVFVIWALVALAGFYPQLRLDQARFLWVDDVTAFSFGVGIIWTVIQTVLSKATQPHQQTVQIVVGTIVVGVICIGIARIFSWPAYLFIFWSLLTVVGFMIGKTPEMFIRTR